MVCNGLIKVNLIDDTSKINVKMIDNSSKIDVKLTDYNDKEVRDDIEELKQTKVDKIVGKWLSTNDYTNEEKEKLSTLENYDDSEVRALIDTKQPRGDYALESEIPTKVSELENDEGYITEETDPTVPNHVKNISQNDITNWNNKADMSDIPDVSSFITKDVNNLTYYTLKTNTGSLIDLEINQTTYVVTLSLKDQDGNTISTDTIDLPLENVVVSGSYDETNQKIVLTLQSGDTVDIPVGALVSGLQSEITSSNKLASDLVDDSNSGNKFTTTSEKQTWNSKYTKPNGGIPKTDLASSVQSSLDKADTAIQNLTPAILKDGASATQTIALSSGTGTTALGVKSKATSSYISFTGANAWLGSIGVTSDKKPTFYNGTSYMLAYTSDIPTKTSDLTNDDNFISDESYVHTDNNYTTTEKNKLASLQNYDDTQIKSDINNLSTNKQDKTDNNLQTTNKTITSAINEVNSIAKGANQAVGYSNYSSMITAINAMDDDEFLMGQNIYVVTVNVPDLWVSSVESTSSTYTYVDDATIINDLNTNGYIQVGYYKLSMLETQKVDLTNYVTNTDYASITSGGVIKVSSGYGFDVTSNGTLYPLTRTYEQYQSALEQTVIGKGTLENVITGKNLATKSDIKVYYGSCATGASTAAKVIVCEDFTATDLVAGTRLVVYFTNGNSYNGQATLNVNSTGAKNIYYNGTSTNARYMWVAGESVEFIYNGEQWATINGGLATTTYYGVTKLVTSASSDSQSVALTPRSLYYFANYSILPYYSSSKTYAVGDKVRYTYYIYECITAIDEPEAWTAAHWQQADTIQEQIDVLEARIKALENLL